MMMTIGGDAVRHGGAAAVAADHGADGVGVYGVDGSHGADPVVASQGVDDAF